MKLLRLLLLVALVAPVLRAAEPAPKPATPAEIAYWKNLQADIIAFRAANGAYAARNFMQYSVVQLNDIMSRTEKFLDARDADPVDTLGADLQEYRKQLMAMLDNALTPLRLTAAGHATKAGSANFNPQASMENFLRAHQEFEIVDGYKGPLYKLHREIDLRIAAGGGPRIMFFRSLNLGDSANFEYSATSPAQRNEKFIAASAAIHPALGVLAEHKFLGWRRDGQPTDQILEKREEFIQGVLDINKETAKMSEAQLDQQLAGIPADAPIQDRAMFEFVVALERLKRTDAVGHSVMLENWRAVFAQWLGKADDEGIADGCNDLVVSAGGGWGAFTTDGLNVEARDLKTGAVVFRARSEFPIRGLTLGADGGLFAFTTGGMFRLEPPSGGAEARFQVLNQVSYQMLVGALASASERERYVYAWGAAPAISDDGREMLFKANSSSRITAVAMDAKGLNALVAYSGLNDTGDGRVRWGYDILALPESSQELAEKSVSSRSFNPSFRAPVNAIALTEGAEHVALVTGRGLFGTVELHHFVNPDEPEKSQLALDNQAYAFVGFTGTGENLSVVAGTRNGVVRVWSAKTGDLVARYQVPSGPQGVAMALDGDELVTANLGAPGFFRWSAAAGELLQTLDGDAPKIDPAQLAAELKAEQARRPIVARYLAMRDIQDANEKVAAARKFLAEEGPALEAAGLKEFVAGTVSTTREAELEKLTDAKKFADALKLARECIKEGLNTQTIYFYYLIAARRANAPDADRIHDEAKAAYPQSTDIAYLIHTYRQQQHSRAGNVDAAMKEIDEMDSLRPDEAPHASTRQGVLFDAADRAYKAGNAQAAIQHYMKSLDYCRTKADQLNVLPSIFSLAYSVKNWDLSARVAGAILDLDPNKKNDKQFMDAARYAYQMSQKK